MIGNKRKDVEESKRIRKEIGAIPKQCWSNAWAVIEKHQDYKDADYVEGWVVNEGGVMFEHGWIERSGVVIDTTIPTDGLVYFAALRFTGRKGQEEALAIPANGSDQKLPIFFRFGFGGRNSPEYMQAFEDATSYSKTKCL